MLDGYRTIWIDATDLVGWEGQFTGIQRVEFNLATRFCDLDNVRFFSLQESTFQILDFEALRVEIQAELVRGSDPAEVPRPARSDGRRWLKKTLGKTVRATPFLSIELAVSTFDRIAHRAKRAAVPLRARRSAETISQHLGGPAKFERGDLVLVLGGNWHIDGYMENMGRALRRTDGISLGHVIYDLIPTMQPGFFPKELVDEFSEYIQLVLEDSTVCFAISEHSKADALEFAATMGIEAPPIYTFRLGDHITTAEPRQPRQLAKRLASDSLAGAPAPFIFCPGTVEVRKNHQSLYHAYRLAAERGLEVPHLVIGGKRGWLSGDVWYQMENDPVVRDSITMLTTCQDHEFAWLYANSLFTVYPSLYEGWGLPVAESLQYGKLCIASSATSIPEIGGDLVEYFSPDDTAEILEKIHRYATDRELLAKREALVSTNYVPATWDGAFEQVVAAIEEVAAQKSE